MAHQRALVSITALAIMLAGPLAAQDEAAASDDTTLETSAEASDDALLSAEDLQTLVAPVALYPDTLLIQVLVASTYPLQVVKADELLKSNEGAEPKAIEADIDAQGWDESVAVLAVAFPDVVADMSDNIDWTDELGTAMLAQSDDVMDAVQVMRQQADAAGTLTSNEYQTVDVTQEGDAGDTIIIQPAQPETVYVPQYDTETVYVSDSSSNTGDAIAAGLIAFTTFVVLDNIFDNNDPWNNYWGCRNCGGWGGRPIVRDPRNVNINGDVNIGNNVGWKPEERRKKDARDKIASRDPGRPSTRPANRDNRGDDMRQNLSQRTGTKDISRDRAAADKVAGQVKRPQVNRPGGMSQADRAKVTDRTKAAPRPAAKPQVNKPQAKKPAAAPKRPTAKQKPTRKAAPNRGAAMHKSAPASRAKAGSARGRASAGGGGRGGGGRGGGGRR